MKYQLKNGRVVKVAGARKPLPVVPWDFEPIPKEGDELVPNVPTPEGEELGAELARLVAGKVLEQRVRFPDAPDLCHDCAFRKGSEPNRCAATVMDALKAAVEGVPFYCHHGVVDGQPKMLCRGWLAATAPNH